MSSLTGQKIKDTYQSLLKTDDNGLITTAFKNVTDGSGSATGLYLRNDAVEVSGSLTITGSVDITGSLTVNTINVGQNTLNFIDSTGNIINSLSATGTSIILATGSFQTSGSSLLEGTSSYALTASYALNGGGGFVDTSSLATTGSNTFIGNQIISGSITLEGGVSISGSDNFDIIVNSRQWTFGNDGHLVLPQVPGITYQAGIKSTGDILIQADSTQGWRFISSSGILQAPGGIEAVSFTGSLQGTASLAKNANNSINAESASYLNNLNQNLTITGDITINGTASADYLKVNYIESASIIYSSGSNQFGDAANDTQSLFGRVIVTGSLEVTGSANIPNLTGSLHGTASWATNALTANTSLSPISVVGDTIYSTNPLAGPILSTDNSIFIGYAAAAGANNANRSVFIGYSAGFSAYNAEYSNFLGYQAGMYADNASYSNLIGYNVGRKIGIANGIDTNNIIVGTNITLEDNRKNSINIGGIIFGTGSYSTISGNPYSGSVDGRIGINVVNPQYEFDVSGSTQISDVLILPPQDPLPSGKPTGSLAVSGSGADCKIYFFNGSWNALF